MTQEQPIVNPLALLSIYEERYNRLRKSAVTPVSSYEQLLYEFTAVSGQWQEQLSTMTAEQVGMVQSRVQRLTGDIGFSVSLLQSAPDSTSSGGNVEDPFNLEGVGAEVDRQRALRRETENMLAEGIITPQQALDRLVHGGYADGHPDQLGILQRIAYNTASDIDTAATADLDAGIPLGDPGSGSSYKPYERVPDRTTPFENDFQNAFSMYSAEQLAKHHTTNASGIAAGSDNILSRNFQRLQTLYMGELGRRTNLADDDPLKEDPGVLDFTDFNIGPSTDPRYDQTTDRFQHGRMEPKLKPLDFLRSIDLEDIAASTVPEDRPGRSRAPVGFTGYVRRISR